MRRLILAAALLGVAISSHAVIKSPPTAPAGAPGSGTVTNVATGTGLTGGPISTSGTVSLAPIPTGTILGNSTGSTAAPSAQPTGNVLNVLQAGVVFDNATDNAAAITAINTQIAGGGYTVYFPGQVSCALTSVPLVLPSNTVLKGEGKGVSCLKAHSSNVSQPMLVHGLGASSVTIEGMTLDGGGASLGGSSTISCGDAGGPLCNFAAVFECSGGGAVGTCGVGLTVKSTTFQHMAGRGLSTNGQTQVHIGPSNVFTDIGNHWATTAVGTTAIAATLTGSTNSIAATNSFYAGERVRPHTTVGNIVAFTTYYVSATGLSSSAFQLSATSGGSVITPSTSGSAVFDSLAYTDRLQALVIYFATYSINNAGVDVEHNYFTNIGLDASYTVNAANPTLNGNKCDLSNGMWSTYPSWIFYGYPSCVTGNGVVLGTISDNTSNYAQGAGYDWISNVNSALTFTGNTAQFSGGPGIGYFSSSGGTISGNTLRDNNQFSTNGAGYSPVFTGGISISDNGANVANITMSGNTSFDDQGSPTQAYGIQGYQGGGHTYSNILISTDNALFGNATAALSSNLSYISISGTVQVLCHFAQTSNTNVSTTEQNLVVCPVAGGSMGATSSVRFHITWNRTVPTVDGCTFTIRESPTSGAVSGGNVIYTSGSIITSTVFGGVQILSMQNQTAATQTVPFNTSPAFASTGTLAAAPATYSINTANQMYFNINSITATQSASDTCGIYSATVELIP